MDLDLRRLTLVVGVEIRAAEVATPEAEAVGVIRVVARGVAMEAETEAAVLAVETVVGLVVAEAAEASTRP